MIKKLLATAFILQSLPAMGESCATLYEHANYGGAAYSIGEKQGSDIGVIMIERRRWRGNLKGWSGRDRSWNDAISSVKVKKGCELVTYPHGGFQGKADKFHGDFRQVHPNDSISSIYCSCGTVFQILGVLEPN